MVDSLSTAVGNSGSGLPFSFRGETYTLHKLTDEIRTKYSSWIKREAIRQLYDLRSSYQPIDFSEQLRLLQRDIGLKQYEFGSKASEIIGDTETGTVAFFRCLFNDPRVNESLVIEMLRENQDELQSLFYALHSDAASKKPEGNDAPKA